MTPDRYARVRLLHGHRRYEHACREVLDLLAEQPDDPEGHILLALCQHGLNAPEAEATARRAVELAPDETRVFYVLSLTLYRRKKFGPAEVAVRRAIELDSQRAEWFGHLSCLRIETLRYPAALAAADAGLAVDPDNSTCLNNRAVALRMLRRYAEAAATLEAALARRPDDAFTQQNWGWALLDANDPRRAERHFREALRLNPFVTGAKEGLRHAWWGRTWLGRRLMHLHIWDERRQLRPWFG